MESILSISKALGEKNRLRVFLALIHTKELCVCEVGKLLGLAPATVSRHMSILGRAGLVVSQKKGKWVYYRLSSKSDPLFLRWAGSVLGNDPSLLEDRKRIGEIRQEVARCCTPREDRGELP